MLRPYFEQYIKVARGKSARHYITGINSINALLEEYQFHVKDLFAITSQHELAAVKTFLSTRRDVIEQLRVSNNRANYLLRKMKNANLLVAVVAKGRGAKYKLASRK